MKTLLARIARQNSTGESEYGLESRFMRYGGYVYGVARYRKRTGSNDGIEGMKLFATVGLIVRIVKGKKLWNTAHTTNEFCLVIECNS